MKQDIMKYQSPAGCFIGGSGGWKYVYEHVRFLSLNLSLYFYAYYFTV